MTRRAFGIGSAILTVALASCASPTAPDRTQYLLRVDPEETTSARLSKPRVGLERVAVAPYLEGSGLQIETGHDEIRAAQSHVWAEPLGQGLLLYLRGAIAQALGADVGLRGVGRKNFEHTVEVFVEQLHGTMAGDAVLVASYTVESRGGDRSEYRFARRTTLPRSGYPGLVRAEKELLAGLAGAIARTLEERDAPR